MALETCETTGDLRRRGRLSHAAPSGEIELVAGSLPDRRQLGDKGFATIHDTLQAGQLERQKHARRIGAAVRLAVEEGLQFLVDRGEPGLHGCQILGPRGAFQSLVDVALQSVHALAEAAGLGPDGGELSGGGPRSFGGLASGTAQPQPARAWLCV
jgi:hypothetical protein